MRGRLHFNSIQTECNNNDLMGLIKVTGKVEDEEFANTKSDQVNNVESDKRE